jgi:hypothetical protein
MKQMEDLYPNQRVQFILSSNEPVNLDYFQKQFSDVRPAIGTMGEDLHLLSQCDYLIGPPSSYSAWASYRGRVPLLFVRTAEQRFDLGDFAVRPEL